eukprot:4912916-Amphidinium_carterae.1
MPFQLELHLELQRMQQVKQELGKIWGIASTCASAAITDQEDEPHYGPHILGGLVNQYLSQGRRMTSKTVL